MDKVKAVAKTVAKATKAKTFSLPSTAAAWTVAEVCRAVNDAHFMGIPSKSSAKVFLAVFGVALVGQIAVACRNPAEAEEAEHTEPHHTAVVATMSREEDEARSARAALAQYTATIED